ncbi:MAG: hypothetical protein JNM72_26245 [Deltaproteobacteria bacterium]|nr:hypothetical protein [Deltaproteobacteria bacterium]
MPPSTPVRSTSLSLLLALAGCVGEGKPAGAGGDGAGDGGSPDTAAVDCAAAPLDCDGEDNDCDGVIDEGGELDAPRLWGVDNDHDGYPAAAPRRGCAGAEGEVEIAPAEAAVDCDDDRFGVHPGAAENCVGAGDEDCSGLEGCADPACAGRPCTEICDDGVDNDRDGSTDCADALCWRPDCPEDCATAGDEDDDGEYDCRDADCWGPACGEICSHVGDEDADGLADCEDPDCFVAGVEDCLHLGDEDCDGLADCEDVDCVEECVEDCEDGRDNDLDGTEDCDDLDCSLKAFCWRHLDLRTAGPIGARVWHRESQDPPRAYSAAREFSINVPNVTFSGLVKVGEGSSAWCALHAYGFRFGYSSASGQLGGGTGFRGRDFWMSASSYGEAAEGCPTALQAVPLSRLGYAARGGYSVYDRPEVVSYAHGRAWSVVDLTWAPGEVSSFRRYYPSWGADRWWRETTWLGQAVGFAPLP